MKIPVGRIVKHLKNNYKIIIGIIIGVVISGCGVYAATVIAASNVGYSDNASLGATNVQDAIDKLNTKATIKIKEAEAKCPSGKICTETNSKGTIFASKIGICINRNNIFQCFKINNYDIEKDHIRQVLSDVSCNVNSSYVFCNASDFYCGVKSNGFVICYDNSDNSHCSVNASGSVTCL